MKRALSCLRRRRSSRGVRPRPAPPSAGRHRRYQPLPTQLPRTAVPHHYAITVTPHAERLTFDGKRRASTSRSSSRPRAGAQRRRPQARLGDADGRQGRRRTTGARSASMREAQTATLDLPARTRARRLPARHPLFGQDQHAGERPVRARLQECRRQGRALAVHAVRGGRRAALRARAGTSPTTRRPWT